MRKNSWQTHLITVIIYLQIKLKMLWANILKMNVYTIKNHPQSPFTIVSPGGLCMRGPGTERKRGPPCKVDFYLPPFCQLQFLELKKIIWIKVWQGLQCGFLVSLSLAQSTKIPHSPIFEMLMSSMIDKLTKKDCQIPKLFRVIP